MRTLLVVEDDVRPPHAVNGEVRVGDVPVIRGVPAHARVVPLLKEYDLFEIC